MPKYKYAVGIGQFFVKRPPIIGCLNDPANVQQTSSKCIQNIRELLDVCWTFSRRLLEVCWTFAGSCKHPI